MKSSLRKVTVIAALVLGSTAGLFATAQPASAATAVNACFRWDTGGVYAGQPVHLEYYTGSAWKLIRSATTTSGGCITFNTPNYVNYYVRARGSVTFGNANTGLAMYTSNGNSWATPGQGGVNLGTLVVQLTRCTSGLYGYCAGMR